MSNNNPLVTVDNRGCLFNVVGATESIPARLISTFRASHEAKLVLFGGGMLLHLVVLLRLIQSEGRALGVVSAMVALTMAVTGFQILSLWLHAKTYSWSRRFDRNNPFILSFYKLFKLETGLITGLLLTLTGSAIMAVLVFKWINLGLTPLPRPEFAAFASTLIIIGVSCFFSSLFISAMSMSKGEPG